MLNIGYLGPPGTFSELAARYYIEEKMKDERPKNEPQDEIRLTPFSSLQKVLLAVEKRSVTAGIVPLENSVEGAVNQTLDLLAHNFSKIYFQKEIILAVIHHLLVRPGTKPFNLRQIISHPQALAQCRNYIEQNFPDVETMETSSTAGAAALVAGNNEPWAVIGTTLAAENNGLQVLASNINDYPDNATRFMVVGLEDSEQAPGCKTSVIVTIKDRPGALYSILAEFARRNINLTRIESRPAKRKLGDYLFFIDFLGHRLDKEVRDTLDEIVNHTLSLRILGSYPAHQS
ncbi:MAG: prephenate dehydratase [Peptococcaceae bacterium]